MAIFIIFSKVGADGGVRSAPCETPYDTIDDLRAALGEGPVTIDQLVYQRAPSDNGSFQKRPPATIKSRIRRIVTGDSVTDISECAMRFTEAN